MCRKLGLGLRQLQAIPGSESASLLGFECPNILACNIIRIRLKLWIGEPVEPAYLMSGETDDP